VKHPKSFVARTANHKLPNSFAGRSVEGSEPGLSLIQCFRTETTFEGRTALGYGRVGRIVEHGLAEVVTAATDFREEFDSLPLRSGQIAVEK